MLARVVAAPILVARVAMTAAFVAMIVLTLIQVTNRYALGFSLFWTEELIVLLLVWSMLLGLPVQLWEREEIVVDVLPFSDARLQSVKLLLAGACSFAFLGLLLWTGWAFAQRGWPVSSPALELSRFWFFVPIPLAAGLSILALIARPSISTAAAHTDLDA